MKYSRIIFDIDGTMINSEKAVRLSLAELIQEEWGIVRDPYEINFMFGVPGVESLKALGFSNPKKADQRWSQLLLKYIDSLRVYDGIMETLEALRGRGISLGILTSKTQAEYEKEFIPFGFSELFEDYICAADTLLHKPHPEPMLTYLKRHHGNAEKTLYVGDTVFDAQCAQSSHVDFALALWGTSDSSIPATWKLESPQDLLKL